MKQSTDFLSWLANLSSLEPASHPKKYDSPTPVEQQLWDLEHGFLRDVFRPYASHVQYLSLPFYSHTRQAHDPSRPWIQRLPLFIGGEDRSVKLDILGRYLLLYQGIAGRLKQEKRVPPELGFSFTAFAGNAEKGVRLPPRFLAIQLSASDQASLKLDDTRRTHLLVDASFPMIPPNVLPAAVGTRLDRFAGNTDFPRRRQAFTPTTNDPNLAPEDVQALWASWSSAVDTLFDAQAETRSKLAGYAEAVVKALPEDHKRDALRDRLRGTRVTPKDERDLAEDFYRFLAWNFALGFERVLYLPFASADPRDSTKLVSWGGLVVVLKDPAVDLRAALSDAAPPPARSIGELASTARAFVDLAIPRVLFQDWAEYTRVVQRPHQRRTARAAIMSRNLSHNVGSHALANPRLYESVGVLHLVGSAPSGASYEGDPDEFPPTEGQVWRARERLGGLHSYLQGRMDFIARALGESASFPQPMFFLGGLLQGILSQTVLLNTLLSDHGFTARNIEFNVKMPGTLDWLTFKRPEGDDGTLRHASLRPVQSDSASRDVLVAVPGGMTGRHAFYALLENVLRNAAKYGSRAKNSGTLAVWLELTERIAVDPPDEEGAERPCPCYQLTMWDNLSLDPISDGKREYIGGAFSTQIRGYIAEDIIREKDGQPQSKGHGIQEMKVCAQFLAGGDVGSLAYPDLQDSSDPADDAYRSYLSMVPSESEPQSSDVRAPLRCFNIPFAASVESETGTTPGPAARHLAYSLLMLQPKLLGLVPWPAPEGVPAVPAEPTVAVYSAIEGLAAGEAHFGLICPTESSDFPTLLGEVAKHHMRLPFRLLIALPSDSDKRRWESAIAEFQEAGSANWWGLPEPGECPFPLPPRRLYAVTFPEALRAAADIGKLSAEEWQALIRLLYEKWLDAYKGEERRAAYGGSDPGPWHLAIGFDRDGGKQFASRWGFDHADTAPFHAQNVALHIYCRKELQASSDPGSPADKAPKPSLLLLDNHGKALPFSSDQLETAAAGHLFGATQIALFELLENPPQDPFNRAFLVFSIVEALLTNIFVIDERVAQSTFYGHDLDLGGPLLSLNRAGIYPLYSVVLETDEAATQVRLPLSPELDLALAPTGPTEGLVLTNRTLQPSAVAVQPAGWRSSSFPQADCIVIHEGVIDVLAGRPDWRVGLTRQLHHICPWVVRTSGRGAGPRHLGGDLPFLEFSDLSDSTYRQMNKISLSSSLLALRGGGRDAHE